MNMTFCLIFFCYVLCLRTDDALPVARKVAVDFSDNSERQAEYAWTQWDA